MGFIIESTGEIGAGKRLALGGSRIIRRQRR